MAVLTLNSAINPEQYLAVVKRTGELARLNEQARKRKSILIHGPEAVGKTRLLQAFLKNQPLVLHAPRVQSPRELLLTLVSQLRLNGGAKVALPSNPMSLSSGSLKGVVQRALDELPFLLALDHLASPSRVVTGLIKDLNYFDRTPVIFVARSPHMEDIGTLQPMCAGQSERLELSEFAPSIAWEFVRREAQKSELQASNLDDVLRSLVDWSRGNPGALVHMVKMAHFPRYRVGDQIKAHVLYLDYRMGRRD